MSKVFKLDQCIETEPCKLVLPEIPIRIVDSSHKEKTLTYENQLGDAIHQAQTMAESILAKAKLEADQLLENARDTQKQAEEMLSQAASEAEKIKEEAKNLAFAEGKTQGREAGLKEIKSEMAEHLNESLEIINETEIIRAERIASSEPEIIKLAVAVAEKVIAAELQLEPNTIHHMVGNALSKISGASQIKIRMNSDDYEKLSANGQLNFETVLNEPKPVRFEADPLISQGGCFIETELGNVDARVKLQLDKILTELLKVGQLA